MGENSFHTANTNINTLLQASACGHLGTCVVGNSPMYPWLFKHRNCGLVGDDNVDNKTIAVRSDNNKNITINHKGGGGGGRRDTAGGNVRG